MHRPAVLAVVLCALLLAVVPAVRADEPGEGSAPASAPDTKAIDLVICLDTSGSMKGLIDAARQKLWSVVSEMATAKPTPNLRVALLTYGSPGNDDTGHVVLQSDLTADLDLISEKLFALSTSGGEELVGRVVAHALEHLSWSREDAVRIVFVAGNESADQDTQKPFREQAKAAVERGILVNAIYCGGPDDDDAAGYRELAVLGEGRFAHIDHNHGTVAVRSPYDHELSTLSALINETYVAYGRSRLAMSERQREQDGNAQAAGAPAAAQRAEAKAGRLYRNSSWDLVDRLTQDEEFDIESIPAAELPEAMRSMTTEEKLAYLQDKQKEREAIQARIRDLAAKRDAFVREEMERRQLDDSRSLDRALKDAIREQTARGGFEFEDPQGAR